jgi:hypothetical protein
MTDLLSPIDTGEIATGDRTQNLAPFIAGLRPALRRPDVSGEHPIYQPKTIGVVDEPTRLAAGETLVLPVDATPVVPRPPVPAVYLPAPFEVPPPRYRGEHRKADPAWAWALIGAGLLVVGEAVAALFVLVVAW